MPPVGTTSAETLSDFDSASLSSRCASSRDRSLRRSVAPVFLDAVARRDDQHVRRVFELEVDRREQPVDAREQRQRRLQAEARGDRRDAALQYRLDADLDRRPLVARLLQLLRRRLYRFRRGVRGALLRQLAGEGVDLLLELEVALDVGVLARRGCRRRRCGRCRTATCSGSGAPPRRPGCTRLSRAAGRWR